MSIRYTENNFVTTTTGIKPITEIEIGDEVLCGNGTYNKILNIVKSKKDVYRVKAGNFDELDISLDQNIYTRKKLQYWNDNEKKSFLYKLVEPKGRSVLDLIPTDIEGFSNYEDFRVGCPINKKMIIPHVEGLDVYRDHVWYLSGLFLANGRLNSEVEGEFIITCEKNRIDKVESKLNKEYKYQILCKF